MRTWRKRIFAFCCQLVQPLWKTVWWFLKKSKTELPSDPTIPLLVIYSKKTGTLTHKDTYTSCLLQHYLQQPRYVLLCLVTQSCPTLCDPKGCSLPVLCPWDSPGKNTGVGCHAFLHGILSTQRSNPGLPNCRQILYRLSRKTKITGMGHLSLLQGIFWPRNWTRFSCIIGRFFTSWATREAQSTYETK